jgi:uncharacterized repeat protein (TIGR03803 family)
MSKQKLRRRHLRAVVQAAVIVRPQAYQIEPLEKRVLLSTYTLNTLAPLPATGECASGVVEDSSGNLFGLTWNVATGTGTVFEIAHGTGIIATLATFSGTNVSEPYGDLALDSSGNLFGTSNEGGAVPGPFGVGDGTVFEVPLGSGAVTTLASFNGANGESPNGGVVLDSSGNLFGTTAEGGASYCGTVFEIAHGSRAIADLASFNGANGRNADACVVLDSSGNLFGTTEIGGDLTLNDGQGDGTVFEIGHGSGVITTLASFNSDNGPSPTGSVVLDSSGDIFGLTSDGGTRGDGTVFEIPRQSGAVTTLASFNVTNGFDPINPNGLALDSSGNLFGTTVLAGDLTLNGGDGYGLVFEVAHWSGVVTTLLSFNGTNGDTPAFGVVLDSSGNLFGTTESGGANGDGTVFELVHTGGTNTSLTSSNGSSICGQPVTFTATVAPLSGETGTVQFWVDGNAVGGPVTLSDNTAAYTTSTLTAGNHSVVAIYSGDSNFTTSTSPTLAQAVTKIGSSTNVTSNNQGAFLGQPITFTATVEFSGGSGATGNVQFQIDGSTTGISPVSLDSVFDTATYTTSALSVGSHTVLAIYSGDANFAGSTGGPFTQIVSKGLITTTITSNNGASIYGQPVTYTVTVTPTFATGSGVTGSVQFQIDGSNVGSAVALSGNTASYTTTSVLTAGSHSIQAVYSGDSNFYTSASPTFTQNVAKLAPWSISTLVSLNGTNGSLPFAGVVMDCSGNLFGTTNTGGANGDGTVFEISHATGVITTLASFNGANGDNPQAGAVLDSSGNLFGTTHIGGANGYGTVFEVANGTNAITALASFNTANGNGSAGVAVDSSGNLFGTTANGGDNSDGMVFEIAQGSGVITTMVSFNGANGRNVVGTVVLDSSGNIFGTTSQGGTSNVGTVYEITHGSGVISSLASFNSTNGGNLHVGVVLDSSGNLFGATYRGGANNDGTVYEIAQGSGAITDLASLEGTNGINPGGVALDSSGNLFGTASGGGANSDGTVFEIAQGSGVITTLASFNSTNGASPNGVIMDPSGNLFGTTYGGGTYTDGTVFELPWGMMGPTITSSNASTIYGQSLTFTATVSSNVGVGPTGAVQFQIDGSNVGGAVSLSGNTATYTTSTLNAGSRSIVAVYSGDGNFASSTSPAITQSVAKLTQWGTYMLASFTGANGENAYDGVVMDSFGNLFGTTECGGNLTLNGGLGDGTVFEIAHGTSIITTLTTFNGTNGSIPYGGVVLDCSGNIFGTTNQGGTSGYGTVFEIASGTNAITTLALFNGTGGENPRAGVVLDTSGDLFGTTWYGGDLTLAGGNGAGTIFEIAYGSDIITTLAAFNITNGQNPRGGVILDSSGDIFGTAQSGGTIGDGTFFEIPHGTGVINAVSFNGANGFAPEASMVLDSSGNIFGTTRYGGNLSLNSGKGDGTVFEIANGSGVITALASFNGTNGQTLYGGVVLDSFGNLFGATNAGGTNSDGTVYEIARGSGAITTLVSLGSSSGWNCYGTVLLDSTGNLFCTAYQGGSKNWGSVFELTYTGTTVTSSNASSFHGQSVTFTATVNPNTGAGPSGTVQFMDGSNDLGSAVSLIQGSNSVTYTTSILTAGSHAVWAVYSGDGNFASTTSPAITQSVAQVTATTTAITSNNSSPTYGQSVTFTATVTPSNVDGGSVQFTIDGTSMGSITLSGNTATYTTSILTAASHTIVATYGGDGNFAGSTTTFTQNVGQAVLNLAANTVYLKLDSLGQNMDVWNNPTATGTPTQCLPCASICGVTYTGPAGGDMFVLDFSAGDPLPASGLSLTGGAGQNTLKIMGSPANDADTVAIKGGSFTIPASTPGAGTLKYALGTVSIAAGASLALVQSDSQADQTVFTVNSLSLAGTLDITNNTLLANETNLPMAQVTTWVQNAGNQPSIMSSLVTGPNSRASRAIGYGDHSTDPLTVPAGDVEVKYVPTGDTNLDGFVDITDITRAINNLGQSPGYSGGDVLNQGIVNITDIAAIINDLGGNLSASGDGAGVAAAAASVHAAVSPPPAGNSVGSLFSDTPIAGNWLESQGSVLGD